jgi:hypothetical protein
MADVDPLADQIAQYLIGRLVAPERSHQERGAAEPSQSDSNVRCHPSTHGLDGVSHGNPFGSR